MASFLFFSLVFLFFARFVLPTVLRFVVGRFIQKQARRYGADFGQSSPFGQPRPTARPTGEVRVDYVPPQTKKTPTSEFKGGEYVDFEEVK